MEDTNADFDIRITEIMAILIKSVGLKKSKLLIYMYISSFLALGTTTLSEDSPA
jgi:hypothetical protein